MDTYLLWALNTLFQDLFDPVSTSLGGKSQGAFPSLSAPSSSNTTTTLPEAASSNVQQSIQNAAAQTGLSPALLKAVATVESGLDPSAVSSAGAIGLMQLMPETAQSLGVNAANPAQNALGGAEYLKNLLNQFGHNLSLALAAYNAGPGAVAQYGGIPPYPQTQHYVADVLSAYKANT